MKKSEVIELVTAAIACFPMMQTKDRDVNAINAGWFDMLGDLPFDLATAALKKVLSTAKFFPTVAEIREAAASLKPQDTPDAELAWAEVWKAITSHGWTDAPESLKALDNTSVFMTFRAPWDFSHPVIAGVVKAMWGSWAAACREAQTETAGVQRAQFQRMYQTMTKREREAALLPPAVRDFARLAGDKLRLLTVPADRQPIEPEAEDITDG